MDVVEAVAADKKLNMDLSPFFEGLCTLWKRDRVTTTFDGGGCSLDPIWTHRDDGPKATWRKLLNVTFSPVAQGDDPNMAGAVPPSRRNKFVVGNNHTHNGSGNHAAGNNEVTFKPKHLKNCFKTVCYVAKEKDALPILVGDHNVTFSEEHRPETVVPLDWEIVPGNKFCQDWVFCPKLKGFPDVQGQIAVAGYRNDRVFASDGMHGAIETEFHINWSSAGAPSPSRMAGAESPSPMAGLQKKKKVPDPTFPMPKRRSPAESSPPAQDASSSSGSGGPGHALASPPGAASSHAPPAGLPLSQVADRVADRVANRLQIGLQIGLQMGCK